MFLFATLDVLAILPCAVLGLSGAIVVWWVLQALSSDDMQQDAEWRYDVSRINALRRMDSIYRLFHPMIKILAKLNQAAFADKLPEVAREILAAGLTRYWLPEEYLARGQMMALLLFPVYLYFCYTYMGAAGVVSAIMMTGVTAWYMRRRLTKLAERRLVLIKRRIPFLLDLLTLLMESGSSFLNALKQSVHEFHGHPVAVEFGRVLTDMNMGKARTEAFDNMRRRLNDDEITGIVGSIIQSEELGTPLAQIFRTQADVLRVKRSQRAETIAGEAGVQMLLPAMLVMASTVLIILGPFLLNYTFLEL